MIYVDDCKKRYGRMKMAHLFSVPPDIEKLTYLATIIGLKPRWLHVRRPGATHYDLCQAKRRQAIKAGATPITHRQAIRLLRRNRREVIL